MTSQIPTIRYESGYHKSLYSLRYRLESVREYIVTVMSLHCHYFLETPSGWNYFCRLLRKDESPVHLSLHQDLDTVGNLVWKNRNLSKLLLIIKILSFVRKVYIKIWNKLKKNHSTSRPVYAYLIMKVCCLHQF